MTQLRQDDLTQEEVQMLRERVRVNDGFLREVHSVEEIAEAAGLTEDEVRNQLDAIRAERAFSSVTRRAIPWAALLGAVTLIAALYYVYALKAPERWTPMQTLQGFAGSGNGQGQLMTTTTYPVSDGRAAPPPGSRIEVVGQHVHYSASGEFDAAVISYESSVDGLTQSLVELGQVVAMNDNQAGAEPTILYMNGRVRKPRANMLFYDIHSWARPAAGFIDLPVDEHFKEKARQIAESVFAGATAAQNDGMRLDVQPGKGSIIVPPPGISLVFDGRGSAHMEGPKLAFAPLETSIVVKRLTLAIEDAMVRDLRPPTGAWNVPAKIEKFLVPAYDRITCTIGKGLLTFEVPTAGTTRDSVGVAAATAIRKALDAIPAYVEQSNRKARQDDEAYRVKHGWQAPVQSGATTVFGQGAR